MGLPDERRAEIESRERQTQATKAKQLGASLAFGDELPMSAIEDIVGDT